MRGAIRKWRASWSAAVLATTLLIATSVVQADFQNPQGGNEAVQHWSREGQQASGSGFGNNAAGGWWAVRQRLQQAGITIGVRLVLEGFHNLRGGLDDCHVEGASTLDLSLALDTERLLNWQGGKFYVDLEDHAGQNPSTALVGDLQIFDKLNSARYLQVFELWYQQRLLDGALRIKIGKVDANTEFSVIDNGLPFINSSAQVSPTIFMFPTTPDPMPAVNLFVTPSESYYAAFGAYYANRSEKFGDFVGNPQAAQFSDFGTFLIGETGLRWRHPLLLEGQGNLKLGAWGHTGTFARFDGSQQHSTYGYYAILDQTLWQPAGESGSGRGLRAFLEYGDTQRSVSAIDRHSGGGVTWTGLLAGRPDDIVGVSPQYAHVSRQAGLPHSYELAVEMFYELQINQWAALKPDLQYIINPGAQYADAVVATMHLKVRF